MLKYHNLFLGIKQGLETILLDQKSPAVVLANLFKTHKKWGKKDRAFVAETIYDVIRWKSKIEAGLKEEITKHNIEKSIGAWFILKGETLPDFSEFQGLDSDQILSNYDEKKEIPSVKYSLSSWLYEYGKNQFGTAVWHNKLEALNQSAKTVLRCNTKKINPIELQKLFEQEQVDTTLLEDYPQALLLASRKNILSTKFYLDGLFQIQDASSQLVAPFLQAKEGMVVIDACAGAGGKSLHLSNLMKNKGKIIAMDISPYKLVELEKRKKISGDKIIKTHLIKETESLSVFDQMADRVLMDVPCSSSGIIRRNPAIKWNLTSEKLNNIIALQQQLLGSYAKFLKPSGLMVYSTCSVFPEENQLQIERFLKTHSNFSLVNEHVQSPYLSGFDGFYMALLQKNS